MRKDSPKKFVRRTLTASIFVGMTSSGLIFSEGAQAQIWASPGQSSNVPSKQPTAPAAKAPTPSPVLGPNDPGCPAKTRQGSYAPCMAELPKGALVSQGASTPTPPVGLYHYLNSPQAGGVHTSAIPKAQSIAMLPNPQKIWAQWKKVPLLAVTYSARLDGGIGQSNPTSAPLTAQFACPTVAQAGSSGIPGWSAGAPAKWSGWDLKWTSHDTSAANTPNKGWNGWDYTCQFTPQPTQACSVQYISGYDSQGNPIYSTYNYTAYGQWSWNDGNNGAWSQPSCNNPGPGNASPPPPKPSCGAGQTETAAPTWNGAQWVGLQCSAPPQQQPTGGGQGNGNNNNPQQPQQQQQQQPTQYTGDICAISTALLFDGATTISQLTAVKPDGSGAHSGNFWGNGGNGIICHSQAWLHENSVLYRNAYTPDQVAAQTGLLVSVAPGIYYDPVAPAQQVFNEMHTFDGRFDTGGNSIIFEPSIATASGFQKTIETIAQQLAQQAAQIQALQEAEALADNH